MALEVETFLAPTGELEPDTWPSSSSGGDTAARLAVWIGEAQERTASLSSVQQDAAGRHYVYAKAYRAMASRLAAVPSSASQAGISHSISAKQIDYWNALAQSHEAQLEEYLTAPDQPTGRPRGSRSIPTRAVW